jgi:hypothetical protein
LNEKKELPNMGDDSKGKKPAQEKSHWWFAGQLIAGLDASAQLKLLLFLVHLHQNKKTGRAWASQETLGLEMGLDVSRVKEHFAEARRRGFVGVDRQRKGQQKQFNQYWLNIEQLSACQRPDRHQSEHGSPAPLASADHGSPVSPGHSAPAPLGQGSKPPRPRLAGAPEGFELDSGNENSKSKGAVSSPVGSPAPPRVLSIIETKTEELAQTLQNALYGKMLKDLHPDFEPIRLYSQREADSLGIPFATFRKIYEHAMRAAAERLEKRSAPPKSTDNPAQLPVTRPDGHLPQNDDEYRLQYNDLKTRMWEAREKKQTELAEQLHQQMNDLDDACRCKHRYYRWSCSFCLFPNAPTWSPSPQKSN